MLFSVSAAAYLLANSNTPEVLDLVDTDNRPSPQMVNGALEAVNTEGEAALVIDPDDAAAST